MNEQDVEEVENFIEEELGFCGCGEPGKVYDYLVDVMKTQAYIMSADYDDVYGSFDEEELLLDHQNDGGYQLALYVLDKHGYLEHGGSVAGSWPTNKGKAFIYDEVSNYKTSSFDY